jgi:hypothetical protein
MTPPPAEIIVNPKDVAVGLSSEPSGSAPIARGKHVLLLLLIRADRGTATAATSGEKLVEGPRLSR